MHQVAEVDLVLLVKRRRQVVLFDFALRFARIGRMRLIAEIELLVDRYRERLEAPAALQFQGRLHAAAEPERLLVLEDVEGQRDRRDDPEILVRLELVGTIDLLEPVLRRPDLIQIQEEHQPPNIPWKRG